MKSPPDTPPTALARTRVLAWFGVLDLDQNGFVTRGDLMQLAWRTVEAAGSSRSSEHAIRVVETHEELWEELWGHLGRPHSDGGPLHSSDFLTYFAELRREVTARHGHLPPWSWRLLRALFAVQDHDGDGRISARDRARTLAGLGADRFADPLGALDASGFRAAFMTWLLTDDVDAPANALLTGAPHAPARAPARSDLRSRATFVV